MPLVEDRLVDETIVSEITGIKIRTLRKWRLQGRGPSVRRVEGRLVRYSLEDVQEWMRDQPSLKSEPAKPRRNRSRGAASVTR